MSVSLRVEGEEIRGEFEVLVPPGTLAARRDAMVDDVLMDPLYEAAKQLGVVLAADPHTYARQLNGRGEQGGTRFEVRARAEGGRLVPIRGGKLRARG